MGGKQSKKTTKKSDKASKKADEKPNEACSSPTQESNSVEIIIPFEKMPNRDERPSLDVDSLIVRLLNVTSQRLTISISEEELMALCNAAKEIFKAQPMCLEVEPPLVLLGDTHGQYADLLRIFDHHGFPPTKSYLMLGDYVDRGPQSIETIALLFCYKLKYPESFFMLRGNHESNNLINIQYGFYKECKRRYMTDRLFQHMQNTFVFMPMTALIGGKILCMHGGISPVLENLDQLRNLPRPNILQYNQNLISSNEEKLSLDVLWSDPSPWLNGWNKNPRGASWLFGEDVFNEMCKKLGIDMIVRAHQVVPNGYDAVFKGKLVTIFSAPHYMGQFDNAAGSLIVDETLLCTVVVFKKNA